MGFNVGDILKHNDESFLVQGIEVNVNTFDLKSVKLDLVEYMEPYFMDVTTDLRLLDPERLFMRIQMLPMNKGRIILTSSQITFSILNLAKSRGIEIIVEEYKITIGTEFTAFVDKPLIPYPKSIFYQSVYNLPSDVYFNEKKKTTTLKCGDGSVTTVRATKGDTYDKKYGFLMAYFQKQSGLSKTQANKYLKNIVEDEVNKQNDKK